MLSLPTAQLVTTTVASPPAPYFLSAHGDNPHCHLPPIFHRRAQLSSVWHSSWSRARCYSRRESPINRVTTIPYFPLFTATGDNSIPPSPTLLRRSMGIPSVRSSSPSQSFRSPTTRAPLRRCCTAVELPLPVTVMPSFLCPFLMHG
jgi:hypothetical protein